jgi:hypothetical protein
MDILDLIASIGGHKGKVRSFSHVDGNYATHVYLEGELYSAAFLRWLKLNHLLSGRRVGLHL